MTSKYRQLSYHLAHQNIRYQYNHHYDFKCHSQIVALSTLNLATILNYDRKYFPAPRGNFIKRWIKQPDSIALGFIENGVLAGYGVLRKCKIGAKIGPLFAESQSIANHLFQALLSHNTSDIVFIDIPECNPRTQQFVQEYDLKPVFATARMYRNGKPDLNLNNIYGITSFELG